MSSFHCKQFTVKQDNCAMKVNTDSLILGSWAEPGDHRRMLDVGTGSGILSLMMMQRAKPDATIDAIDIDEKAACQAADNARWSRWSRWSQQIQVTKADLRSWQPQRNYSLIISNPPYFESPDDQSNAYKEQSTARKQARAGVSLPPEVLLKFVNMHMHAKGELYCLYPTRLIPSVVAFAESLGLSVNRRLDVRHSSELACYVSALCIGKISQPGSRSLLTVRDDKGKYSDEYRTLCQAYYLKF